MNAPDPLRYQKRLQRVLQHIEARLTEPLELADLAGVANFSPFHFQRIFSALIGETPQDYIRRLRLERAANQLLVHKRRSVLDIALSNGFETQHGFAKAFRKHFGMNATQWRSDRSFWQWNGYRWEWRKDRNPGPIPGNFRHLYQTDAAYSEDRIAALNAAHRGERPECIRGVRIDILPAYHAAVFRRLGHQLEQPLAHWREVLAWAELQGVPLEGGTGLCVCHDNINITPERMLRLDTGLVVPADYAPDGVTTLIDTLPGRYLVVQFEGAIHEEVVANAWLWGHWFNDNPYEPDDRPTIYRAPYQPLDVSPDARYRFDICIPVRLI
ncbi:AraC family transcriptional regulator [Chitinilyticum piscinae]|uniref:Helix-turn-helix domain-containing protein n=1 Tax=Chitinilyticum piscinae TaxID=2866724 RepID=A0A8J7FYX5_9NEIS|nr:helix-turn-helix domain-containing protein [Chitinilyticum piscinae]MBE9608243.1 helix-turn-helix domain-containing protein [Chitinilyticum piscinae]